MFTACVSRRLLLVALQVFSGMDVEKATKEAGATFTKRSIYKTAAHCGGAISSPLLTQPEPARPAPLNKRKDLNEPRGRGERWRVPRRAHGPVDRPPSPRARCVHRRDRGRRGCGGSRRCRCHLCRGGPPAACRALGGRQRAAVSVDVGAMSKADQRAIMAKLTFAMND